MAGSSALSAFAATFAAFRSRRSRKPDPEPEPPKESGSGVILPPGVRVDDERE
jgi:hypothetical protein